MVQRAWYAQLVDVIRLHWISKGLVPRSLCWIPLKLLWDCWRNAPRFTPEGYYLFLIHLTTPYSTPIQLIFAPASTPNQNPDFVNRSERDARQKRAQNSDFDKFRPSKKSAVQM